MTTTNEPLTLNFIEGGVTLGHVRLINGELLGKPAFIKVVKTRMQRNGGDPEATIRDMHGWSNGYLTTRLEGR